jgi:hypothetical protein
MRIVARMRCDELSSALLQSGPGSARYYLRAVSNSRLPCPDGSVQALSAVETTAAPGPATQTWCSRLRQWQSR